jgi:hypothetical protein
MFGLFQPTCPCDPAAKRWVEGRLRWLTEQFGLPMLLEWPIILPTPSFFPDPWDGTEKAARTMFRRVCDYMRVEPDDVGLRFFDDKRSMFNPDGGMAAGQWQSGGMPWEQLDDWRTRGASDDEAEGTWTKGTIRLERSILDRPADLVGTMAHELAHQRLLGEQRLSGDEYDNELLTDLTAIYHGFGVFLANNPRKSVGEVTYWPNSKLRRPEYLSEPMIGYALAHIAWFRDESKPDWARHLRWVPRGDYKQGLRYLEKKSDSSFKPVRLL